MSGVFLYLWSGDNFVTTLCSMQSPGCFDPPLPGFQRLEANHSERDGSFCPKVGTGGQSTRLRFKVKFQKGTIL